MTAHKPLLSLVRAELRIVSTERPQGPMTIEEKRAEAIRWLRARGRYILDKNAVKPSWGVPQAGAKK